MVIIYLQQTSTWVVSKLLARVKVDQYVRSDILDG